MSRVRKWNTRFKELLSYRSEHGDCDVPARHGELGQWVHKQRGAYKAGSLAQGRIDRLNNVGFKWSLKKSSRSYSTVPWATRFNELVRYKAKLGDCDVPWRTGYLGTWVKQQRRAHTGGSLAQDRIDRLSSIGFKWAKKRVSSPSTNVDSRSVRDGSRCVEPGGFKGEGRKVPSKRSDHSHGTESEDEVDEIGALIYDQVMRQRQPKL